MKLTLWLLVIAATFYGGLNYGAREANAAHQTAAKALQEMDRLDLKLSLYNKICPFCEGFSEQVLDGELELVQDEKKLRVK